MKRVTDAKEKSFILRRPTVVRPAPVNERGELWLGQANLLTEYRNVHAPLIFAAARRRGAIDDDFSLSQREMAAIEQPRIHKAHK